MAGCLLIFITTLNLVYQWSFLNKQILLVLCRKGTKIKVDQIHSTTLLCHIFCHFSGTNYFSVLILVSWFQWPKLVLFVLFCLKALLVPGMKDRFKFLQQSRGDMAKTQLLYHLTSLPGERESPSTRKGSPLVGLARLLLGCRLCGEHSDKLITLVHFAINIFAVNVAFS